MNGRVKIAIGSNIIEMDWVEYENRAWIVPLWYETLDGKTRRPLRLIAPKFAPGIRVPDGPEILEIFREMQLPPSLLEQGHVPAELEPLVEVRENPDIIFHIPDTPSRSPK